MLARWGGDEFCVLMGQGGPAVKSALNRLAAGLAARGPDAFPPLSLSLGLATYDAQAPPSIESLIEQADTAMYLDKIGKRASAN